MNKRPTGITILSILALTGGIGMILTQIIFHSNLYDLSTDLGISSIVLFLSVLSLGLLSISSGIGMWLGKKWGWWLGTFYYVYAVLRYVNSIITITNTSDHLEYSAHGIENYIIKHMVRIVIHTLIFLYFFKDNVMEYFNLLHYSKIKSALIVIGLGVGIFGTISIMSMY